MIDDMAVYIANLGKYNEGYLVGAWFTFPIDEEDVKEKIGLNEQYEEYAIHDTDNFPIAIGEYVSIEELNEMYEMIEELPDYIVECLDEFISHYGTLEEVVEHKDDIYYYPDCETMTDVAYYYIDELQALGDIPPSLQNYIDYEAYEPSIRIRTPELPPIVEVPWIFIVAPEPTAPLPLVTVIPGTEPANNS